ncbi:MAG TPA: immunoglobulin domain-containing protein [Verrucomicrobiae bacterium]
MKTFAITLVLAASCLSAPAQGQVQFRNYVSNTTPAVDARVSLGGASGPFPDSSNTAWRAALLGGPTTATPASTEGPGTLSLLHHPTITTLTWVNFRSGTTPPAAAGYVNYSAGPAREVPGVDWGGTALVQMVAWQGPYTTWIDAYNAFRCGVFDARIGFSNPLTLRLPYGLTDTRFTYLWGLNWFSMANLSSPYFKYNGGPDDQTVIAGDPVTLSVSSEGWPAPDIQWYFNGNAIPGANDGSWQILHARPEDAGGYFAVMSWCGEYTSRVATVTVRLPPGISAQPQSQTVAAGSGTQLRVNATGDAPLSYQWFFNGSTSLGIGTSLNLASLQPQDSGAYTVVVTNVWGAVTSAPAMLSVVAPVPMALAPGVVVHAQSQTSWNLQYADSFAPTNYWIPMGEMFLGTNTSQVLVDSPPLPGAQRSYRAWQQSSTSQPPVLSMELVPAIRLTNAVGSSVRIDYINQVGPIDAWVTLATVTVTGTSQLYFDKSAIGQPPRVYRVVTLP